MSWVSQRMLPILAVVLAIFVVWYAGAVGLNSKWAYDKAKRADVTLSFSELVADTWSQESQNCPHRIRWPRKFGKRPGR